MFIFPLLLKNASCLRKKEIEHDMEMYYDSETRIIFLHNMNILNCSINLVNIMVLYNQLNREKKM